MQLTRNPEKNKILFKERGISFEDIQSCIDAGNVVDIIDHHNQEIYSHQSIILVNRNNYIYAVPFIQQID